MSSNMVNNIGNSRGVTGVSTKAHSSIEANIFDKKGNQIIMLYCSTFIVEGYNFGRCCNTLIV